MPFWRNDFNVVCNIHHNVEIAAFKTEVNIVARDSLGARGKGGSIIVHTGSGEFDRKVFYSVRDGPGRIFTLDSDDVSLGSLISRNNGAAQCDVTNIVEGKRTVCVNDGDAEGAFRFNQDVALVVEFNGTLFLNA